MEMANRVQILVEEISVSLIEKGGKNHLFCLHVSINSKKAEVQLSLMNSGKG